jgi:hypothetical protein
MPRMSETKYNNINPYPAFTFMFHDKMTQLEQYTDD